MSVVETETAAETSRSMLEMRLLNVVGSDLREGMSSATLDERASTAGGGDQLSLDADEPFTQCSSVLA